MARSAAAATDRGEPPVEPSGVPDPRPIPCRRRRPPAGRRWWTRSARRSATCGSSAGLSLQQLARRADVSAAAIHKVERGDMVPTITTLLKLAAALERPIGHFVDDDASPSPVASLVPADARPDAAGAARGPARGHHRPAARGSALQGTVTEVDEGASGADEGPRSGEDLVHVLDGELSFEVAGERHVARRRRLAALPGRPAGALAQHRVRAGPGGLARGPRDAETPRAPARRPGARRSSRRRRRASAAPRRARRGRPDARAASQSCTGAMHCPRAAHVQERRGRSPWSRTPAAIASRRGPAAGPPNSRATTRTPASRSSPDGVRPGPRAAHPRGELLEPPGPDEVSRLRLDVGPELADQGVRTQRLRVRQRAPPHRAVDAQRPVPAREPRAVTRHRLPRAHRGQDRAPHVQRPRGEGGVDERHDVATQLPGQPQVGRPPVDGDDRPAPRPGEHRVGALRPGRRSHGSRPSPARSSSAATKQASGRRGDAGADLAAPDVRGEDAGGDLGGDAELDHLAHVDADRRAPEVRARAA